MERIEDLDKKRIELLTRFTELDEEIERPKNIPSHFEHYWRNKISGVEGNIKAHRCTGKEYYLERAGFLMRELELYLELFECYEVFRAGELTEKGFLPTSSLPNRYFQTVGDISLYASKAKEIIEEHSR
jgi:hypothetical protein